MLTIMTLIIFILTYVVIMTEKYDRAVIACIGGVGMLMAGVLTTDTAFLTYMDWNTISLLFSMMVIVTITSQTGIFEYIAIVLAKAVNGRGIPLLIAVSVLTAFGSAFLANVTIVLLLVPIILTLTTMLGLPAIPYLVAVILSANIGGTATLIGDPPNIMIGQAVEHLTFNAFLMHLAPIVFIIFLSTMGGLILLYRKKLKVSAELQQNLRSLKAEVNWNFTLVKSLSVLGITIAGFMLHTFLHLELTTVAMAGALLLLFLTHDVYKPEEIFKEVEWGTLFFFMGLFLLVGGLEEVGIIDELARGIIFTTEGDYKTTALLILWLTGLLSGFVDNIPFVAAMIPVISEFEDYGMTNLDPLWWSLALGACLGGNGTLLGSSSNLVVAGLAAKSNHPLGFLSFMKIGLTVVIFSLIISTVYIYFRYLIYF
ncbi:ArsB/NhaD family transporter [Sutcliffiella sp. NPDC057660]|uniref:ArsB/NhaD family transporter n=1 Tax=Sutcliffiella sp. NPDC057660 TaxID=3346199 RepID=UPI003684FA7C